MKSYDAKQPQECKICGFKLSHNKQGRFTTHLKQHSLTLENNFKYVESIIDDLLATT